MIIGFRKLFQTLYVQQAWLVDSEKRRRAHFQIALNKPISVNHAQTLSLRGGLHDFGKRANQNRSFSNVFVLDGYLPEECGDGRYGPD